MSRINSIYNTLKGPNSGKDTFWSWIVLISGFTINMCSRGLQVTFGIIFSSLLREYKESKGKTALVGSIMSSLLFMCAPIVSIVIDKFGTRNTVTFGSVLLSLALLLSSFCNSLNLVLLTYGLMGGIGASFLAIPCAPFINQYFEKRTEIALGILASGVPFAALALSPLFSYVIDRHGLKTLFIVLSITLGSITLVAGLMFVPTTTEVETKQQFNDAKTSQKLSKHWRLLKSPAYIVLLMALAINSFSAILFETHVVEFGLKLNIPWSQASTLLPLLLGLGSFIGRLVAGLLYSRSPLSPIHLYQVMSLLTGVISVVTAEANSFAVLSTLVFFYAVGCGGTLGLLSVPTLYLCGPDLFLQAWAILLCSAAITSLFAPSIVGWIEEALNNYKYLMYVSAAPFFLAAIILLALPCVSRKGLRDSNELELANKSDSRKECHESEREFDVLIGKETCI